MLPAVALFPVAFPPLPHDEPLPEPDDHELVLCLFASVEASKVPFVTGGFAFGATTEAFAAVNGADQDLATECEAAAFPTTWGYWPEPFWELPEPFQVPPEARELPWLLGAAIFCLFGSLCNTPDGVAATETGLFTPCPMALTPPMGFAPFPPEAEGGLTVIPVLPVASLLGAIALAASALAASALAAAAFGAIVLTKAPAPLAAELEAVGEATGDGEAAFCALMAAIFAPTPAKPFLIEATALALAARSFAPAGTGLATVGVASLAPATCGLADGEFQEFSVSH